MKNVNSRRIGFWSTVAIAVFLSCITALLAQILLLNRTLAQQPELAKKGTEKQMEKEESQWVAFLRNKDQQKAFPGAVPDAINEIGKIARLRGISSLDTMRILVEYLDVHKDSLMPRTDKSAIIYSRRPVFEEELYPAVVTFEYIGKPALPVLLSVIEDSEIDSVRYKNAVYLVKHNFREDWSKASDYLREAAESVTAKEKKQRLLNAANEIYQAYKRMTSNP